MTILEWKFRGGSYNHYDVRLLIITHELFTWNFQLLRQQPPSAERTKFRENMFLTLEVSGVRTWSYWNAEVCIGRALGGNLHQGLPNNTYQGLGLIQTSECLWLSSDVIDFQGHELVFHEVESFCWRGCTWKFS